jgi:hypothetical protein
MCCGAICKPVSELLPGESGFFETKHKYSVEYATTEIIFTEIKKKGIFYRQLAVFGGEFIGSNAVKYPTGSILEEASHTKTTTAQFTL